MQQESDSKKVLSDPNFRIILGIVVMGVVGGSVVAPILPSMVEPLGTTNEMVGLVMSVYTFCALLSTPFHGMLADRFGRKKVLVPALVLFGITGFSIAFVKEFYAVLILRGLQGVGTAGMMSLGVTVIGDIFNKKARAVAMGYRSSAQSFINVIMPFVSGTIATLAWFYPFLIYILALPLALFVSLRLNISEELNHSKLRDYFRSIATVMKDKKTLWVYISVFFVFVFLYCLIVYAPMMIVEELKLSTLYTGILLSVGSGIAAITSTQSGRVFYRFRNHQIVSFGFLMGGISLFLISLTMNYAWLLGCVVIWGIGFGLVFPALNTMVTELVSSHLRAGVVSGFTAMIYVGQTFSPPFFGFILGQSDLQFVFILASLLTLIPVVFTLLMHYVYRKV
jgi:MFS family permease